MSADLAIVLLLLLAAVVMFAVSRPRMDVVALLMMTVLPFTRVISVPEALAGFAEPNVILIAMMFVIGEGLVRTGVAQRLGDLLSRRAGRNEASLMVWLMVIVATIGSVMSSTGIVAIFIPVVLRVCRNSDVAPGRLMMPLSIAALISGMMTLVATAPNLVVQGLLVREGHAGFHFFTFLPFGATILIVTIGYMLIARRWLPGPAQKPSARRPRQRMANWIDEYSLAERGHRLRVMPSSSLAQRALKDLNLRSAAGLNVIAIERAGRFANETLRPTAHTELLPGDVLYVDVFEPTADISALCNRYALEPLPLNFRDRAQEIGMAEAMIPANSNLIDKSIAQFGFRTKYDLTVIGLKHGNTIQTDNIVQQKLQIGDTLLLMGPWRSIRKLQANTDDLIVINLPSDMDDVVPARSRAPYAIATLGLVVCLMVFGIVPNVQAALIGCLLMGLFGCVDLPSAYRSIHWQSLILIVGMIPFSMALEKTGGVTLAADAIISVAGSASPRIVLAGLFLVTALLGMFISNTATAILMAPVAVAIATLLHASALPFAMVVALASSTAFMTPVASPVNTLVVGPGNYTFFDFVRIGIPITVFVLLITVLMVPWLLPF